MAVTQRLNETVLKSVQRFCHVRGMIPKISDKDIVAIFTVDVTSARVREKRATQEPISVVELFRITKKCAKAEKGNLFGHNEDPSPACPSSKDKHDEHKRWEPSTAMAELGQKHYQGDANGPHHKEKAPCPTYRDSVGCSMGSVRGSPSFPGA
jgi:hypothetical protein